MELSELIDRVESDGYQGTEDEEKTLQATLNVLVAFYVGDPEVDDRIRAVEVAVGFEGGGKVERWGL